MILTFSYAPNFSMVLSSGHDAICLTGLCTFKDTIIRLIGKNFQSPPRRDNFGELRQYDHDLAQQPQQRDPLPFVSSIPESCTIQDLASLTCIYMRQTL